MRELESMHVNASIFSHLQAYYPELTLLTTKDVILFQQVNSNH
jgi:hypothetical protein